MGMPIPNMALRRVGILMFIIGVAVSFYGRYKYTKEEEKERTERAKKQ